MKRVKKIIGPNSEPLTRKSLPPRGTTRWVVRRKAEIVAAVEGGLITLDEACSDYNLSVEEFLSWQNAVHENGLRGLRFTKLRNGRDSLNI